MFLVSDDVLERLICSQCKKYLSVKTIKVYPNRGIKCGRCSTVGDAGVVSLFRILAGEALFRCINRFEGCNKLLSYADVAEHEKSCIGKEYDCICCTQPFKGTAYEIYIHFKDLHAKKLLLNNPEFVLSIDNEFVTSYLYRKSDLLFYINIRYSRGMEELILSITYFGTNQDAGKITQMFTIHSLDTRFKCKTKKKSCCSVTEANVRCFKVNISPEVVGKSVVCRFDLNTENVENLLVFPGNVNRKKEPKSSPFCKEVPAIKGVFIPPILNLKSDQWGVKPSSTEVRFFDPYMTDKLSKPPRFVNTVQRTFDTGVTHPTSEVRIFDPFMADKPSNSLPFMNTVNSTSDAGQAPASKMHVFDPCMANASSNSTLTNTIQQRRDDIGQLPSNEVPIFDPYTANEPSTSSFSNTLHDTFDLGDDPTTEMHIFNPCMANEPSDSKPNTLQGNSDIGPPPATEIGIFDAFMVNEPANSPFTDIMHRTFDTDVKAPTTEGCAFHPCVANKSLCPPFPHPFRGNGANLIKGAKSETTVTTASHVFLTTQPCVFQSQIATEERTFDPCMASKPSTTLLTNTLQLNRKSDTGPKLESLNNTKAFSAVSPSFPCPKPTGPKLESLSNTKAFSAVSPSFPRPKPTGPKSESLNNTEAFSADSRPKPTGAILSTFEIRSFSPFSDSFSCPYPQSTDNGRFSPFKPFGFQLRTNSRRTNQGPFARGTVNVNQLSDNELRWKLRQYGFPVMPVTATTRKVLRSKLSMLLFEKN